MTLTRTERPRIRTWLANGPRWFDVPELGDWLERDGMRLEVVHEPDATIHRIELPGIDPERDLRVELDRNWLTVTAERRDERQANGDGPTRSEFHYGRFSRRVAVPSGTEPSDVSASYRDGILEVRVTTGESGGATQRIEVTRG